MAFDAADLAAFVDIDMPGYVSATVNGQPVAGLFREQYAEAFGLVGGSTPALRVLESVSASVGNAVAIAARNFLIVNIKPELLGMKALILEAA